MRATPVGRLQNGVLLASAAVLLGALALNFAAPGEPSLGSTMVCLAALALIIGMHVLVPGLQGRQVHQMVAPQGEFRATVDDTGVRLISRDVETTYRWPILTRHTETNELFVLMSPDKYGVLILVLPKRGLSAPADVDRLRAVIARNTTDA